MSNDPQKPKNYSIETITVLSVVFELGFIIALPIIALGLAGKWLDQRHNVGYWKYIGIGSAILITSFWAYARFKQLVEKLREASQIRNEQSNRNKNPDKSSSDSEPKDQGQK